MHKLSAVLLLAGLAGCHPSKQQWIDKFEPLLVNRLCAPDFVFVHCFEVDEAGCRAIATPSAHKCIAKLVDEMPSDMNEDLGRKYGELAGQCVGNDVNTQLASKIRTPIDPKCSDANAWK